ncbi:MAG: malate synthase A [Holophagaceae bacterium]|nr:malate synthase A [Holophagaceae bacterium]
MRCEASPKLPGISLLDPDHRLREEVLGSEALAFVADLARAFQPRIQTLLKARLRVQAELDAGKRLDFLPDTRAIRDGDWTIAPLPEDLRDRRVEITGPPDRKMVINALNSGARCFMADFEDSCAPTWNRLLEGQKNLMQAVRRTLQFEDGATGRSYRLNEKPAVLMVRPRGLHLEERHMAVDGVVVPAPLFDFGLYVFHNAKELVDRGSGPYLYLPKLEHHEEATLWRDIFVHTEAALGLRPGSIRATVLIETLPAAFQMDEILFALKDHIAGLNCGRWDYIFSFIKKRRMDPGAVLPDRASVGMMQPFLRTYSQLLIQTCHRRGALAMGGMAAQIPIKEDVEANEKAMERVRQDKLREVTDGHDGTWVAHPGLVALATEVFDAHMSGPNQLHVKGSLGTITADDLLQVPDGPRTEAGLRHNVRVGIRYLEAWLGGNGCVPIDHLMEDAATAEISRAQVWQWLHHRVLLTDGRIVDRPRLAQIIVEEMARLRAELGDSRFTGSCFAEARLLFESLCTDAVLQDFLTIPAYGNLLADELMARVS